MDGREAQDHLNRLELSNNHEHKPTQSHRKKESEGEKQAQTDKGTLAFATLFPTAL